MKPSAFASLVVMLLLIACDDDEHTSNVPPDLRLEDVLGCWTMSLGGSCRTQCFDRDKIKWYQHRDSSSGWIYETAGRYQIIGYTVDENAIIGSNQGGIDPDSVDIAVPYRRIGSSLSVLNSSNEITATYRAVDLSKELPCGKPFAIIPKPANWTLF